MTATIQPNVAWRPSLHAIAGIFALAAAPAIAAAIACMP